MIDFEIETTEIIKLYPKLNIVEKHGIRIFAGELDLISEKGELLDTYKVEIHPSNDPYKFPIVFETGSKIPIDIDWHIYVDNGRCCIKIPPEEELICKRGITFCDFIKDELIPYFFNQTFRRENGYYINERSHGIKGLIEFYGDILKTNDLKNIILIIGNILFRGEPERTSQCFCGKKEKYRRCHRESRRQLLSLKRDEVLSHLDAIIAYQQNIGT